jgi:hypothetical protein
LPTYTVEQLQRLADTCLSQAYGANIRIPVDIDWLVEEVEGVDLTDWPKLRSNYGIEGGVWRDADSGALVIVIAEELMDDESPRGYARYRMTVAEELAHLRLHKAVIDQITHPDKFLELQRHPTWPTLERNAKRFAAALLMPGAALSARAEQSYTNLFVQLARRAADPSTPAAIGALKKWLCSDLAKQFEVSEMTMDIRLKEWPMRIYNRVEQAMNDGLNYLP